MKVRPRAKTLKEVVEYLNSIGLEVQGPNTDLNDGQELEGLMIFDAEEVAQYAKLYHADKLWSD